MKAINFDKVADIYDHYVKVDFDIPFFLNETENYSGEILELMCGTGRVSIPLLEAGRKMTCIDYSKGMLDRFQQKIEGKKYPVNLVEMDVTRLKLEKKFSIIILPFHSISEIISPEKQKTTLHKIAAHLNDNGTFILTLQNPITRLQQADGQHRKIGEFSCDKNEKLVLSSQTEYHTNTQIVSGFQFYNIYNSNNELIEYRKLEINFRLISNKELREMLIGTNLEITAVYGDYDYTPFDEQTSNFMSFRLKKI